MFPVEIHRKNVQYGVNATESEVSKMLDKQKIRELQAKGMGYRKIAMALGLPENTVKSHCRRHPYIPLEEACLQCKKAIQSTPHKRKKKFCSDACRMIWWNAHQNLVNRKAIYSLICRQCGKSFESYGKSNRQYCSRACYAQARKKVPA